MGLPIGRSEPISRPVTYRVTRDDRVHHTPAQPVW
jgi:hypothetical protein